jgi:hypothetical protein
MGLGLHSRHISLQMCAINFPVGITSFRAIKFKKSILIQKKKSVHDHNSQRTHL